MDRRTFVGALAPGLLTAPLAAGAQQAGKAWGIGFASLLTQDEVKHVHRDILTGPDAFVGTKNLFASLEKAGERFTFGMEPGEVPRYLAERGVTLEQDIGAAEYRERYFGARARQMRGHEFYRIARARVAVRP